MQETKSFMSEPDVSVVIITWKMKPMLRALLRSIYHHSKDIRFETIVVDNGSSDGTIEMVKDELPDVCIISNMQNRGIAPARNQAYLVAKGRYILSIDADMIFQDNTLYRT
jgi:glycosyltransferase involved in cell wall biosynthesis